MPTCSSLKECKEVLSSVAFKQAIDQVKRSSSGETALPNPELYIIVNGKPTSSNIVWRTPINVENITNYLTTKISRFTVS